VVSQCIGKRVPRQLNRARLMMTEISMPDGLQGDIIRALDIRSIVVMNTLITVPGKTRITVMHVLMMMICTAQRVA